MSVDRDTPPPVIVGFDGLHRVGKGTQISMMSEYLTAIGISNVSVRGDGTRDGKGDHPGDPFSLEWQERSHRLKTYDRSIASWNLASFTLITELDQLIRSSDAPSVVLVDRTILSRAAFLYHRGAIRTDSPATFEELYPDAVEAGFDVVPSIPGTIFNMTVRNPEILIDRLEPDDPKFEFRAQNIRGGFEAARVAAQYVPEMIQARVVPIDAVDSIDAVHQQMVSTLGLAQDKLF